MLGNTNYAGFVSESDGLVTATLPTNFPTRKLAMEISDYNITNLVVSIPANWNPGRDVEISVNVIRSSGGASGRNTSVTIGDDTAFLSYTSASHYRIVTFRFDRASGVWTGYPQALQTRSYYPFDDQRQPWPTALPVTVDDWEALWQASP